MDGSAFDGLSRSLSTQTKRRGLLGLLTALPIAGVTALHRDALTDAASGRQRHKKHHHKGKGKCHSKPQTVTCAGRCATVVNNCGRQVDCGPCACTPPCPLCQTCDAVSGQCVPVADNTACDDGNPCTTGKTCQVGVCSGTPVANRISCGDSNICCGGTCCSGCCSAAGASGGTCGACLVFISSTLHNGNLGGLSGADAICQNLANAAAPPLPGSYKAWLSIGTGPNESPATGRFRQSGQPYTLVTGTQIAANWADLIDGTINSKINLTEGNSGVSDTDIAWTHTNVDGTAGGFFNVDCTHWASTAVGEFGDFGEVMSTDAAWTRSSQATCNTDVIRHLYCFQQD
jgi:Protein of unknown function (DUF1554)